MSYPLITLKSNAFPIWNESKLPNTITLKLVSQQQQFAKSIKLFAIHTKIAKNIQVMPPYSGYRRQLAIFCLQKISVWETGRTNARVCGGGAILKEIKAFVCNWVVHYFGIKKIILRCEGTNLQEYKRHIAPENEVNSLVSPSETSENKVTI